MSWDKIVAGDYGQLCKLTITDPDTGAAADVSGYTTTQEMIFYDPDGNSTAVTAAFDSNGSDGLIKYTLADGIIDEGGTWGVRAVVASGSAKLSSEKLLFKVEA